MEKKVKIELPKKYVVGVRALVPATSDSFIEIVRTVMGVLKDGVTMDKRAEMEFASTGMALVSSPLIRSIAETKMNGLNGVFRNYCVPMEAFLKREDEP